MKRIPWTKDELILSMHLYLESKSKYKDIPANAIELEELSELFRTLHETLGIELSEKTRSVKSIYARMQNFKSVDPEYNGVGLIGGGKDFRIVWNEYYEDRNRLIATSQSIKENLLALTSDGVIEKLPQTIDEDEAPEGKLLSRVHYYKERNPKIIKQKKEQALDLYNKLICEACSFDFEYKYKDLGKGFIECHHTKPIATLNAKSTTKLEDLALVCSNCHRMIHRTTPCKTINEIKGIMG